ncbi:S8 family serine peptidase [Mesohalobacter halotolerans]|uniref:T9SS type A sorting domain-containing protein n=1 Tax=Mesohalobacter halotolerans TaxID=1883405 RepID=A0A4U5TRN0_9FLAO|nr:S8 family serine peptidase [Mesohalobacter halotolerans]TKS56471.1 T9SS type A sorting domain-containing protein [Mesohalobacter halotolerans]
MKHIGAGNDEIHIFTVLKNKYILNIANLLRFSSDLLTIGMTYKQLLIGVFIFTLSYHFINAQTFQERLEITSNYDLRVLNEIAGEYSKQYKKDKREAIAYALEHDIELIKTLDNGGVSILEKVLEDGTLIYIQTYNAGSAQTINTNLVHPNGSSGLALDGQDINLGIWDGGIVRSTHQELVDRVTQLDNPNGLSSHATHVAGTMIASGVNPNAKGMAFAADLSAYDFGNDTAEMTSEASNGMLVSNHSYGINPAAIPDALFGAYLSVSANVDQLVYNAPYYLPVFAAGNSRNVLPSQGGPFNDSKNGFDLISGKNLAKNILCVANVLEVNNYQDASSVVMSNSSSWGPTDDGRIKPDISAKGTNTFSSIANSDTGYANFSGTSMAAPSVSGSIGLLHQHHNNMYNGFLNAASMRALVIHTAREAGDNSGPDYKFGWGLMDTAAAADLLTNKNFTSIIEENTLNNGATYSFTVDAVDPNTPLVATIAWSDPAGPIQDTSSADDSTPRLVNDLDIRVIAPDGFTEFKPWKLTALLPNSPATKSDNSVDNVEKVEVDNASGQYTIQITHKGTLQNLAQDYSIVISGIAESNFALQTDIPNRSFCADEIATFDLEINSIDSFNGNINLSASGLPANLSEAFSPSNINSQGTSTLNIDNLSTVSPGDYPFTVTATSGSESFSFDFNLNIKPASALPQLSINNPNSTQLSSLSPVLNWDGIPEASDYEVELSTSSNFDSLFFSQITEDTQVITPELESDQQYYWRVRPISNCVMGSFTVDSFTTKPLECLPITFSNDTPVNIVSSGPNLVQSVINISGVSQTNFIEDINVNFELTHTWLADLEVTLTSPAGTTITLLDQPCDNLDDVDVTFDDKGLAQSCNGFNPPALLGLIKPDEKLSTFVGENLNGDWILTVNDMFPGDGGSIDSFGIELCYEETLSVSDMASIEFSIYPNPSSGRVVVNFNQNISDDVKIDIIDLNGRALRSFAHENSSNNFSFNLSDLSSGIYFVRIKSQNQSAVKKLILK